MFAPQTVRAVIGVPASGYRYPALITDEVFFGTNKTFHRKYYPITKQTPNYQHPNTGSLFEYRVLFGACFLIIGASVHASLKLFPDFFKNPSRARSETTSSADTAFVCFFASASVILPFSVTRRSIVPRSSLREPLNVDCRV